MYYILKYPHKMYRNYPSFLSVYIAAPDSCSCCSVKKFFRGGSRNSNLLFAVARRPVPASASTFPTHYPGLNILPRPPIVDGLKISSVVLRIDGRLINGPGERLNRLIALKVGVPRKRGVPEKMGQ